MQPPTSSPPSAPTPSFLDRLKREVDQGGLATPSTAQLRHNELPQDTALYEIYDTTHLPPSLPPPPSALSTLRSTLLSSLPPYLSTYLWHSEPFTLHTPPPSPSSSLPRLSGSTHFSHCLDDLYLLTSLLFHLSRTHPSLLIHLVDSDGHFLLIDAAHTLPPSFASPEGLDHRVWIRGGQLHIIPAQIHTREEGVRWMGAEAARGGRDSLAPPAVQAAVRERLSPYPDLALRRNSHRLRCLLPVLVARVLREDESVVCGAVAALDARDLIDMRVANKMAAFLSPTLPSSVVPMRVRFTHLSYAQVESQVVALPRSLQSHPALAGYASLPPTSPMRHAWTVGVKLMLGMEMYLAHLRSKQRKEQTERATLTAARADREAKRGKRRAELVQKGPMTEEQVERELRGDEERKRRWRAFRAALEKAGWFEGTKRGEQLWKQQLTLGLVLFEEEEEKRIEGERREKEPVHAMSETERRHLEVMERVLRQNWGEAEQRKEVEGWTKWEELEADDSDKWLHAEPEELQAMNGNKEEDVQRAREGEDRPQPASSTTQPTATSSSPSQGAKEAIDAADEERLRFAGAAVKGVKGFLSVVSSHEGAELPSDRSDKPAAAKSPPTAKASAVSDGQSGSARHQRLMAALACDESGIEAAVAAYEADYGRGSFDADLMVSVGHLHLDGDDQPHPPSAEDAVDEKKEAQPHLRGEEEEGGDEDVDMQEEEDDDGYEDEGKGQGVDEELSFGEEQGSLRSYFASMDAQLRAAGLGSEFARRRGREGEQEKEEGEDEEDEEDDDEEGSEGDVDEDLNLLRNLLDSFTNQNGSAGPASNLLGAMGLQLPNHDRMKQRREEH